MKIGVLKETKDNEFRVALVPVGAKELCKKGADVFVEAGAGMGSGFSDDAYEEAGAKISSVAEILGNCELILKIKEPVGKEKKYFDSRHTVFTYFHFASNKELTESMLKSGANCIAYETVTSEKVKCPLLAPMSKVAGRMAPHIGAYYLAKPNGGRGVLLQGIDGVEPAKVVVLGGGNVGANSVEVALGMGANVTVLELPGENFEKLRQRFPNARVVESNSENIEREVKEADVFIGSIYVPGEKAKKLVSKELVAQMKEGSVIIDVCIDQGGAVETSRPTSHSDPVYKVDGVIHYCVANMPGAYPRTSTIGITSATMPYLLEMLEKGIVNALKENKGLRDGVNIWRGKLVNEAVAKTHGMDYEALKL